MRRWNIVPLQSDLKFAAALDPNSKSDKPVRKDDGSIALPGADKQTGGADDVTVKPNKNGSTNTDNSTIDTDGNVNLPDGGKVTYPAATDGKSSSVTVPGGTTVKSDGSLTVPEGGDSATKSDGTLIPGGSTVNATGKVTYRFTLKYTDAKDGGELAPTKYMMVSEVELPKMVKTVEVADYKANQVEQQLDTSTDAGAYTVTFAYEAVSTTQTEDKGTTDETKSDDTSSDGTSSDGTRLDKEDVASHVTIGANATLASHMNAGGNAASSLSDTGDEVYVLVLLAVFTTLLGAGARFLGRVWNNKCV